MCAAGQQIACSCADANQGSQSCKSDGSGYEPCVCGGSGGSGGETAGAGGAAGGGAGAGGSGGGDTPMCAPGTATNITGSACDLVAQDCAPPLTCAEVETADGSGYETKCDAKGTGTEKIGEQCQSNTECEPGLRCMMSKCSRPCCPEQKDAICGAEGQCQTSFCPTGDCSGPFFKFCTFPCTPWSPTDNNCGEGPASDCHLTPGGLACSIPDSYVPPTEGATCTYNNECQDSQSCWYAAPGDPMGVCRWLCKLYDGNDAPTAGTVGGNPGEGGCAAGTTCQMVTFVPWLGVCLP